MFRDIINVCDQPEFYNKPGYVEDPEEEPTEPVNPEEPENPEEPVNPEEPETPEEVMGDNEIWYTTLDGNILAKDFSETNWFGNNEEYELNLVSHTYENGKGKAIFSNNVTSIFFNEDSFWSNAKEVYVPSKVVFIGMLFSTSLEAIYMYPTVPPEILAETFGFSEDETEYSSCPIYVPADSIDAYKSAEFWSEIADRIMPMEQ